MALLSPQLTIVADRSCESICTLTRERLREFKSIKCQGTFYTVASHVENETVWMIFGSKLS